MLGAILLNGPRALELGAGNIRAEYFADARHRKIYGAACELEARQEPVDITTVAHELRFRHEFDDCGGSIYLAELMHQVATPESVDLHAKELRRMHVLRSLSKIHSRSLDTLTNGAARDPASAMAAVSESLDELQEELAGSSDLASRARLAVNLHELDLKDQPSYVGIGLLPAAELTLLVAQAGTGKTWLAFQLAVALALGAPFMGFDTTKCRVGILELENPMIVIRDRLDAVVADLEERDRIEALSGISVLARDTLGRRRINFAEDWRSVVRWVRSARLDVLIVDSLQRTHAGDENSEMAKVLTAYERILDATGVAQFVIHHERKPAKDDAGRKQTRADDLAASRGMSMLTDSAKALWRVLDGPPPGYNVRFGKVNLGQRPDPLYLLQGETGTFRLADRPMDPKEEGEANRKRVCAAIEAQGVHGIRTEELVALTGLTSRTIQRHAKASGAQQVDGRWLILGDVS